MKLEAALSKVAPIEKMPAQADFNGFWKNELGSTMNLTVEGQQVSGDYTSLVSGTGQKAKGKIVGFVNGSIITFVVNWDNIPSIGTWTGQLYQGKNGPQIDTLWLLNSYVDGQAADDWQTTLAGSDTFLPVRA